MTHASAAEHVNRNRWRSRIDWRVLLPGAVLTVGCADGLWFGLSAWLGPPHLHGSNRVHETLFPLIISGGAVGGVLAGTIAVGLFARPHRAVPTALVAALLVSLAWGPFVVLLPLVLLAGAVGGWAGSEIRQLIDTRKQVGVSA